MIWFFFSQIITCSRRFSRDAKRKTRRNMTFCCAAIWHEMNAHLAKKRGRGAGLKPFIIIIIIISSVCGRFIPNTPSEIYDKVSAIGVTMAIKYKVS